MAIDTVNKRRSVQAYTLGLMRPVADGVIDAGDRAMVAWFYSGNTYPPTPPPSGGGDDYLMHARHIHRR